MHGFLKRRQQLLRLLLELLLQLEVLRLKLRIERLNRLLPRLLLCRGQRRLLLRVVRVHGVQRILHLLNLRLEAL